jgi:GH24 family phage-related lysozyme (muramidase)
MILATCLALLTVCPGWLAVDNNNLHISEEGVQFIKEKEEPVLFVYDDLAGYPPEPYKEGDPIIGTLTIGYGHTGILTGDQDFVKELIGQTITEEEALELFNADLEEAQRIVNTRIDRHLKLPKFIEKYGTYTMQDIPAKVYDYLVITAFNRSGLNNANILGNLLINNIDKAHEITVEEYGNQIKGIRNRLKDQKEYLLKTEEVTPTSTTTTVPPTTTTTSTMPTTTTTTQPTNQPYVDVPPPREAQSRAMAQEARNQKTYLQDDITDLIDTWTTLLGQYFGVIEGGPKPKGKYGFVGDKISEIFGKDK